MIFSPPADVSITFSSLRSRWTIPMPWRYATPAISCTNQPRACSSLIVPIASTWSKSSLPSHSSMKMTYSCLRRTAPCVATTFACLSLRAIATSRLILASDICETSITFTAHSVGGRVAVSSAWYVTPKPPWP